MRLLVSCCLLSVVVAVVGRAVAAGTVGPVGDWVGSGVAPGVGGLSLSLSFPLAVVAAAVVSSMGSRPSAKDFINISLFRTRVRTVWLYLIFEIIELLTQRREEARQRGPQWGRRERPGPWWQRPGGPHARQSWFTEGSYMNYVITFGGPNRATPHVIWQGHQELSGKSDENKSFKSNQLAPSIYIMIELCFFSLDQ